MSETIYHQDNRGLVTNNRVVLDGTTYALHQIVSVSLKTDRPFLKQGLGVIILGLVISLLGWIYSQYIPQFEPWPYLTIPILLLGIVLVGYYRYVARIEHSSGATNLIKSRDRAYVGQIVTTINKAIAEKK